VVEPPQRLPQTLRLLQMPKPLQMPKLPLKLRLLPMLKLPLKLRLLHTKPQQLGKRKTPYQTNHSAKIKPPKLQ
jgi:hypothetical protein